MPKDFAYYIDEFGNYLLIERSLSPNTTSSYINDILQYCTYLEENYALNDLNLITKEHIINFLRYLYDCNLKTKTIARKISAIKMFHKFLFLNNYIKENVSSFIEQPKLEKELPIVYSVEEIDKLLATFNEDDILEFRNKTMLELMYSTGLRVSELVNLNIEDVHLSMGFVKCLGKGNKERIIPIGEVASKMLEKYLTEVRDKLNTNYDNKILFLNKNGTRISRQYFWKILKEKAQKIGLSSKISPHKIRHSYATHLLENKADIRYIQELLGHSNIATTQIYTHIDSKKLNDIINNFHPRNNTNRRR